MTGKHDSLVKALFTNIDDAASALASALPEAVAKRIDWSSLKHANLSLIDREEGREEGRKEGQADLLARLLTLRFGELPHDAVARIQSASDAELTLWAERVLTALSLDEVLRER